MTWVKLDDRANEHDKQVNAGAEACWLWTCGLMYCNRQNRRDGFIPSLQLKALYVRFSEAKAQKLASELVKSGLWETADGGFRIHDYEQYQPAQVSEKRSVAGRRGAERRWQTHGKPDGNCHDFANGKTESETDGKWPGRDLNTFSEIQSGDTGTGQSAAPHEAARDMFARLWNPRWTAKYRAPYPWPVDTGPKSENTRAKDIALQARRDGGDDPDALLAHWIDSYLRDKGDARYPIGDRQHPIAMMSSRIAGYGHPRPKRAEAAAPEPKPSEAPLGLAEVARLGSALKFGGKGGTSVAVP
jgi:hypothetical protein